MTILGRARVSSLEQANNSHALEQQVSRLRSAGCTEILSDTESGKNRKQLQRLIDRIKQGDVTEVVATRIDRITRSLIQLRAFVQLCEERGVNLRILDQHIDLKTSHGKLMLNMLGSVAEWEVDLLEERVRHGWQHLRNERRAPGIVPFGYARSEGDRHIPNLNQYKDTGKTYWEVARELAETFMRVGTIRGTAREMGKIYGPRTSGNKYSSEDFPREVGLKYWLHNPVLRGHLGYFYRSRSEETILIPDNHEPLISDAEYVEIQKLLEFGRKHERTSKGDRKPLAGLAYCGLCGNKLKAYKHKKPVGAIRWYCSGVHAPIPTCEKGPSTNNVLLEEAVIKALIERSEYLANNSSISEVAISDTIEIRELQESLRSLEALPPNSALDEAKVKLQSQIEEIRIKLRQEAASQQILKKDLLATFGDVEFWKWLDVETKRRVFRRFVKRVVVSRGEVEAVELFV